MTVINIVDNLDKVNFGIWNAAIATAGYLEEMGIDSELWYPRVDDIPSLPHVKTVPLDNLSENALDKLLATRQFSQSNTVVITHGCWQFPTRWGTAMKKRGFRWIYVPHGMLEPWSLSQKKWKKKVYYTLFEKKMSQRADLVRAVGHPEFVNLSKTYAHVWLNPNGTDFHSADTLPIKWVQPSKINYLFMARLHKKKGIMQLVDAWLQSPLFNNSMAHLYVAGPDDGELQALESVLAHKKTNITYLGAVYNREKEALLEKCHIYVLPSFSEGFPTSVLEAMGYGLVTVITDGCNFPEAINEQMAIRTIPSTTEILTTLKWLYRQPNSQLAAIAARSAKWIISKYGNHIIADEQAKTYASLLKK